MKRAVVTGGGTAGHVIPALPVIERLLTQGWQVTFIGSASGLEASLVAPLGIEYRHVRTGKLRRYFSLENVRDAVRVPLGLWDAFRLLGRLRPDVVFSKGGYVSFPVVLAAWLRRVPVVAHESDLTPGLANRLALPFICALCVNFRETLANPIRAGLRVVHSGTPLRPALTAGVAERAKQDLAFEAEKPWLVVTGGSLGAERINTVVREGLDHLLRRFNVVHVCGAGKLDGRFSGRAGYRQMEFVGDGWGDILAAAEVVVSRAGANTVYELLALRKPNLLVPLPRATSRGDQLENAEYARQGGYSVVVDEAELDALRLADAVSALADEAPLWRARLDKFDVPDAVAVIVGELLRAAEPHATRGDRSKHD